MPSATRQRGVGKRPNSSHGWRVAARLRQPGAQNGYAAAILGTKRVKGHRHRAVAQAMEPCTQIWRPARRHADSAEQYRRGLGAPVHSLN